MCCSALINLLTCGALVKQNLQNLYEGGSPRALQGWGTMNRGQALSCDFLFPLEFEKSANHRDSSAASNQKRDYFWEGDSSNFVALLRMIFLKMTMIV